MRNKILLVCLCMGVICIITSPATGLVKTTLLEWNPQVGDWTGDGTDEIGVSNGINWFLDTDGDYTWNDTTDLYGVFGVFGWQSLIGDMNGDSTDDIVANDLAGGWYADLNNNAVWDGVPPDALYGFGGAGWNNIIGDWDGDGTDEIGICGGGTWYLDWNGNGTWDGAPPDAVYVSWGGAGWTEVIGDWNNTGAIKIGIYQTGTWYLDANGNGVWDEGTDYSYTFGSTGVPVIGDWDGDSADEIATFDDGEWLIDYNGNGTFDSGTDLNYIFGATGDTPIVGDWNGDGADEIGVYSAEESVLYLDDTGTGEYICTSPTSSFYAIHTTGNPGLNVSFIDTSSNNTISWNWTFGDGNYSDLQNPYHVYDYTGLFNVSLNASTTCGYTWRNITNMINITSACVQPYASFYPNTTWLNTGNSVYFTDTTQNNPTTWWWDFDEDGVADASTQNATFTYTTVGLYDVRLNASNSCGYSWLNLTNYINVTSSCVSPVASFYPDYTTGNPPFTIQFTDTSTNNTDTWYWDFGDGNTSSSQNPTNTYGYTGLFTVRLNASNECGYSWRNLTNYVNITSACVQPISSFYVNDTHGVIGDTIEFIATSQNTPTGWYWDFGDGNTSAVKNTTHQYDFAGLFNISLNSSNSCGYDWQNLTFYINITAEECPEPISSFYVNTTMGEAPLSVAFYGTSSNTPTGWYWDFGEGNTSILQNPVFTYESNGLYNISLNSSNGCGFDWQNLSFYINVTDFGGTTNVTTNVTTINVTTVLAPRVIAANSANIGGLWMVVLMLGGIAFAGIIGLAIMNRSGYDDY